MIDCTESIIYKIAATSDWAETVAAGTPYTGSSRDKSDGFMHFSTAALLLGTLTRIYSGQGAGGALTLIAVDVAAYKQYLASNNGVLTVENGYPHAYGHPVVPTRDAPGVVLRSGVITEVTAGVFQTFV